MLFRSLVGNGASSPIGASCPSPRARTPMCVEPKHPEPKHPVGLPAGSPAQTPSAAIRRAPGAEALVDNEASSWQVRAARPLVRAHECAWSQNTQSQNTRSGCPKAALLRRQARPRRSELTHRCGLPVGRTSEVFRAVAPHPSGCRAAARGGVSRVDGRHSGAPPEAIGTRGTGCRLPHFRCARP